MCGIQGDIYIYIYIYTYVFKGVYRDIWDIMIYGDM